MEYDSKESKSHRTRYLITGFFTMIPLWITWLVFSFLLSLLSRGGAPVVKGISTWLEPVFPGFAESLQGGFFHFVFSIFFVLGFLYFLGWLVSRVIGQRLLFWMESLMERIPLVKTVYGGSKKLLNVLQDRPGEKVERVVLIDFPSPEMKTVGLVTRTFVDSHTGREVAAVYVPTTPNPTSGYLEIVPVEKVTPTSWSLDEAMSFIITGGAVAPDSMPFDRINSDRSEEEPKEEDQLMDSSK